jgi:hypothetical protein
LVWEIFSAGNLLDLEEYRDSIGVGCYSMRGKALERKFPGATERAVAAVA